jgi:Fe-S-cluster containining protein
MDVHFDCTQCGKCCHDLKLLLTTDEAATWVRRGGQVQLLCEAMPWTGAAAPDDAQALYKQQRSFAATSGELATRITVIIVASFAGACPHLQADMRCGIYAERPAVCRIYPAEISPFVALSPAGKACPDEAWSDEQPLFLRDGMLADAATARLIETARATAITDAESRRRLCLALGIDVAALINEGFVAYTPAPERFLAALAAIDTAPEEDVPVWRIASNRRTTVGMIEASGAVGLHVAAGEALPFDYLGFFAES